MRQGWADLWLDVDGERGDIVAVAGVRSRDGPGKMQEIL